MEAIVELNNKFRKPKIIFLFFIFLIPFFVTSCSYPSPVGKYEFYLDGILQERLSLDVFNGASIKMYNDKEPPYSKSKIKWYKTTSKRKTIDPETGKETTITYSPIIIYLENSVNTTWTFTQEDNGNLIEVNTTIYDVPRKFLKL